ncbi:MAG: tyrosine-type recombinase/integrase [Negativicutes bacterium]
MRFHDLRHTHATMLLEHVPVKTISERLGHSSTLITQDLYNHVLPEMQLEAANAMDRILLTHPGKDRMNQRWLK